MRKESPACKCVCAIAFVLFAVACSSEEPSSSDSKSVGEQVEKGVHLNKDSGWKPPADPKQWSVFSPTGKAHSFHVSAHEILLDGEAQELKRSSACTKERRPTSDTLQVEGSIDIVLGPDDKWGSLVLNYFGADGKLLEGKDKFSFVHISKTSSSTPFDKTFSPLKGPPNFRSAWG